MRSVKWIGFDLHVDHQSSERSRREWKSCGERDWRQGMGAEVE